MMCLWSITVGLMLFQGNAFVFKEKLNRGRASAIIHQRDLQHSFPSEHPPKMKKLPENLSLLVPAATQNASASPEEWFPGVIASPYLVHSRMPAPLAQRFLDLYITSASSPKIAQKTVPSWMMPWFLLSGVVQVCLVLAWRVLRTFNSDVVGMAVTEGVYKGEQKLYLSKGVCGIIIVLKTMSGLAQDIFVPSTPQMVEDFNTNAATLGLTLQLNWIFMSLGALAFGTISDKYGRRPVMLWALALFTVTTIGVGTCQNIAVAIVLRCVEGFAEGIWVLCDAIIRDAYPQPDERAKWNGVLDAIASISPMAAPVIGGGIASFFGWRSTFLYLAFMGLLVFTATFFLLPETNPRCCDTTEASESEAADSSEDSWTIIKREFGQSWFPLAGVGLFALISGASAGLFTNLHYILQNGRGYSVMEASLGYLILPITGTIGVTIVLALISSKVKVWPMMQWGFAGLLFAGVSALLIGALENKGMRVPLVVLFVPLFSFLLLFPMAAVPVRILYMQSFGKAAGAAMGFASTMCLSTQAVISLTLTAIDDASGEPALLTSYGTVVLLCLLPWFGLLGFSKPAKVNEWNSEAAEETEPAKTEADPASTNAQGGDALEN